MENKKQNSKSAISNTPSGSNLTPPSNSSPKLGEVRRGAFTLVELIVVIVILAILATVAFLSFSSQSTYARDSVRLSDMNSISKGLGMFVAISGKLPIPENKADIYASGVLISYQGYAGDSVLNMIKLSVGGKDPLDKTTPYTYSTNKAQSKFQLLGFLEDGNNVNLSLSPSLFRKPGLEDAFADPTTYSGRFAFTKGDAIGAIMQESTLLPIQSVTSDLDIVNATGGYVAQLDNKTKLSGTGASIMQINPTFSCKRIKELEPSSKNGSYIINPQGGVGFQVYCDMTTEGGGWTLCSNAKYFSVASKNYSWDFSENFFACHKYFEHSPSSILMSKAKNSQYSYISTHSTASGIWNVGLAPNETGKQYLFFGKDNFSCGKTSIGNYSVNFTFYAPAFGFSNTGNPGQCGGGLVSFGAYTSTGSLGCADPLGSQNVPSLAFPCGSLGSQGISLEIYAK